MKAWSPQQGAARFVAKPYRSKTDKPILRAHLRALRRQLLTRQLPSTRFRMLAGDLLQARFRGMDR
jgi:hypothetical protein